MSPRAYRLGLADRVDALARQLPDVDPTKGTLRRAIAAQANECGCSMGGAFLALASVATVAYFLVAGGLGLKSTLTAVGAVCCACFLGKAVGLGIARVRLHLLQRTLMARLASTRG